MLAFHRLFCTGNGGAKNFSYGGMYHGKEKTGPCAKAHHRHYSWYFVWAVPAGKHLPGSCDCLRAVQHLFEIYYSADDCRLCDHGNCGSEPGGREAAYHYRRPCLRLHPYRRNLLLSGCKRIVPKLYEPGGHGADCGNG